MLTGVSRGLGLGLVGELVVRGHTVAGCARTVTAIETCRERWPAPQRFDVVDVTDDHAVRNWAKAVLADGAPDLLINNAAAINRNALLWDVPVAEFDAVIDVNIKGVANVIRHFARAMIERGQGVIVNISSGWGRSTSPEVAPYCATKWAIEGLTRALAQELPRGMSAVAVNPGIVDTAMLRSCFGSGASAYPQPEVWAAGAVAYLMSLGPNESGRSLSMPGAY
ncbi:MAG TPA: SDR family NAD(P)-dependent oxidoreductase [Pirellulales bacterium]|nr:SDR family NAD(P)-dependent oxidoreductase [Pirellulales bacterium]